MAATLAFGGTNPVTKKQVLDAAKVPGVLAVMATAGLYDDSGKWLYHTGLPAKSGVGGGHHRGVSGEVRHRRRVAAAGRGRKQRPRAAGDRGHLEPAWRQPVRGGQGPVVSASAGALSCRCGRSRRSPPVRAAGLPRPMMTRRGCGRTAIVTIALALSVTATTLCPGANRRRHSRQRRSDHGRNRQPRAGSARVQDRRRRHALSGMGQALQPRGDACRRSAHHRWPPIPGQSRTDGRPIDRRRDLGRRGTAADVGGDTGHPDRSGLLEAARWIGRRGVQLYAVQRCGTAQSEFGHRVSQGRVTHTAHRIAHADEERRR